MAAKADKPQATAGDKPKFKFPPKLGACADALFKLREKRLEMQKATDAVEAEEKALKEHIIQNLPKSEASGVSGKLARVTVVNKAVPKVADWDKFYAHVKKSGQFDLLQRRLTDTAVQERWDAGKQVPGVESFNVTTISINKV